VSGAETNFFSIEQMRFSKGQKARDCPDTILYNSKITVSGIPAKAYEYIVNGKSAIEWIKERYDVTVYKESGIPTIRTTGRRNTISRAIFWTCY
jgi:predicted helicase